MFTWEFQALNNQGLTPRQAMDRELSERGFRSTRGRSLLATVWRPDSVGIRCQL